MKQVILATPASNGLGALTAHELSRSGHIVYACMVESKGRNASQVRVARKFSARNNVDLHVIELNGSSRKSAEMAIRHVVSECGRLDVVIHNSGRAVFGPAEASIIIPGGFVFNADDLVSLESPAVL